MDIIKELRPFFIIFLLFGKCHFKGNKWIYCITLANNVIAIAVCIFTVVVNFLSMPWRGNFHENLSTIYNGVAILIWALVTSLSMFILSHTKSFGLSNSQSWTVHISTKISVAFMLGALVAMCVTGSSAIEGLLDKTYVNQTQTCLQSKEIISMSCTWMVTGITGFSFMLPLVIIPYYVAAYCYVISLEFESLYTSMKTCQKLLEKSDHTIDGFRLKYTKICNSVDEFSSSHGFILSSSIFAISFSLITHMYSLFDPLIPGQYLWPHLINFSFGLAVLLSGPIYLLNKAKLPLHLLTEVSMKDTSEQTYLQTNMFINTIEKFGGVSVMGFMNIDKTGALGILGVMVTYVLVVVQYQPIK